MAPIDDAVLDDPDALAKLDPGEMLRAVATAGAQVREAALAIDGEALAAVVRDGRPRALVVTGMGGSGIAADVATAVAGRNAPLPVLAHRGHRLPGWIGPMDLVVAVSCSGATEETLAVTDEAIRRGARVVTVGAAGSLLASRAEGAAALHLAVDARGRMPRANLWGLAVPVLMVLDALGLADAPSGRLTQLADELDSVATRCGPAADLVDNRAKAIALGLVGSLPYIWGASDIAAVAADRFAAQLAENAKYPAVSGALTEVHHNQVVTLAGPFGVMAGLAADDLFRDRVEDRPSWPRLRLLLLRDTEELPEVARRADGTRAVAERYEVALDELAAEGDHPMLRLASLIGVLDFASVYLALVQGIDPTPIEPIVALKSLDASRPDPDKSR